MGKSLKAVFDIQDPYLRLKENAITTGTVYSTTGDEMQTFSRDSVEGSFNDVARMLERDLNFSLALHRRADKKWGSLVEGELNGMVSTLHKGEADFLCTSLTLSPERFRGVHYLLPVGTNTYAVFILKADAAEVTSWTAFVRPFAMDVWRILLVNALVFLVAVKAVETAYDLGRRKGSTVEPRKCHGTVVELVFNYWFLFCSNFGKAVGSTRHGGKAPVRILLFSAMFVGNIIWMSYRASLTSELSNRAERLPFESLEELLVSDYQ